MRQTDRLQLKYRGMFVLAGGHTVLKTMNDIHKLSYMYIVHVPHFVFIILWYHWCEQLFAYLHCIIWSEQGHIFYILSLLCSDDAVIRFDIVWRKKKPHLSIQAWVRVMFVSVCKYHPLVLSLSLFLTCDISLSYMEKQRKEKKNIFFFFFLEKNLNAPVIWCLLWSLVDCVTWLSARDDAQHLALRVEGLFLLQNVHRGSEGTSSEGTASFYQNVSKKG